MIVYIHRILVMVATPEPGMAQVENAINDACSRLRLTPRAMPKSAEYGPTTEARTLGVPRQIEISDPPDLSQPLSAYDQWYETVWPDLSAFDNNAE